MNLKASKRQFKEVIEIPMESDKHFFIVFSTPNSRLHHFSASLSSLLSDFTPKLCRRCGFDPSSVEYFHKQRPLSTESTFSALGLTSGDIISVFHCGVGQHSSEDNCLRPPVAHPDSATPSDASATSSANEDDALEIGNLRALIDMGFKEEHARNALASAGNDLESALTLLLASTSDF